MVVARLLLRMCLLGAFALLGLHAASAQTTKRYALPYVKIGRLVKYKREDLERFILENRFSEGA